MSTIGSAVDGRVQQYLVNEGDPTTKGQTLAKLRTGTLEIEKAAAEAELDLAQQRLAELENGSLPEDVAEAKASMLAAEVTLKNAQTKFKRLQSLAENNAVSSVDLDDAQ